MAIDFVHLHKLQRNVRRIHITPVPSTITNSRAKKFISYLRCYRAAFIMPFGFTLPMKSQSYFRPQIRYTRFVQGRQQFDRPKWYEHKEFPRITTAPQSQLTRLADTSNKFCRQRRNANDERDGGDREGKPKGIDHNEEVIKTKNKRATC